MELEFLSVIQYLLLISLYIPFNLGRVSRSNAEHVPRQQYSLTYTSANADRALDTNVYRNSN